jgi:hypothetical protein
MLSSLLLLPLGLIVWVLCYGPVYPRDGHIGGDTASCPEVAELTPLPPDNKA